MTASPSRPPDPRRALPAVGRLCDDPAAAPLAARFGREALTAAARRVLDAARGDVAAGLPAPTPNSLLASIAAGLEAARRPSVRRVINATGVVIHTNLGRAPLAAEAIAAMDAAAAYGDLEIDLETGRRSSRQDHLDGVIAEATGAEAGLAVNNGAGAVLLALAALAGGAPVIVSRGELVEIGGGFRVPDVVAQSGAPMIEVGTTNRTHLRDYAAALAAHPDARTILRTHPSNFRMTGFTSRPTAAELSAFARANGLLLIEDLGGGALVDLAPYGIADEPTVQASVAAGVDLVLFSGDKLLGGPQAGLAAGRRDLVQALAKHPLARALRIDKLSLAALGATLRLYRPPHDPVARVPVLRMLTESVEATAGRAAALAQRLTGAPGLTIEIVETDAFAGGGALPMHPLPSRALALTHATLGADALARALRLGAEAVLARIERDRVLLDLRTVADEELDALADAVGAVSAGK